MAATPEELNTARTEERTRMDAILGAPEAAKRPAMARHFATKTALSSEDAIAALKVSPEEQPAPAAAAAPATGTEATSAAAAAPGTTTVVVAPAAPAPGTSAFTAAMGASGGAGVGADGGPGGEGEEGTKMEVSPAIAAMAGIGRSLKHPPAARPAKAAS